MEAKTAQHELEEEKNRLASEVEASQQYLVVQLLTIPDPMQNQSVLTTSQHINSNNNRIKEIVCSFTIMT